MTSFWSRYGYPKFVILKNVAGGLATLVLFTTLAQGHHSTSYCQKSSSTVCSKGDNRKISKMTKIPCAYIPHGGGPLPILGDKNHVDMVKWLKKFADTYLTGEKKPTSCLVVSAHWEAKQATLQSGETTSLYYDYYGFPKESYNLNYTLPGAKALAKRAAELLDSAKIPYKVNGERGFDHGVFIPMMIMFPDGNIPTIAISLVSGLDPKVHIKLGEALAPLREEGVFILGSGMSYHNMAGFGRPQSNADSDLFHEYLRNSLVNSKTYEERKTALSQWAKAPKARECHPREEHLIPLLVVLGATSNDSNCKVNEAYYGNVAGTRAAGYVFE